MTTGTHTESKRRFVTRDLLVVVPIAIVLGAIGLVAGPASNGTLGETVTPVAALVGEHSAGGERAVDALNASIASMQGLRGEHAGLSQGGLRGGGDPRPLRRTERRARSGPSSFVR